MNGPTHGRIIRLRAWALCIVALASGSTAGAHTIADLAPYHLAPEDHFTIELDGITLDPADDVVVRFTALGGGAPVDQTAESFTATEVGVRVPASAVPGQHDIEVLVEGTPNTGTDGRIWVRSLPFELIRQSSGQLPGQADAQVVDFKDSDFADVDNDGFLDIFEAVSEDGGAGNDDRLYINQLGKEVRDCTGTSFFCNETADRFDQTPAGLDPNQRTYDADLVDLDLDGDLDLARGDAKDNVPLRLLINDGSGNFDDRTLDLLPALADVGGVSHWACEVDSGDADGDGRPDLLLCSWGSGNEQNALLLNRLHTTGEFVLANDSPCDPGAAGAHALCQQSDKNNRGCAFGFFDGDENLDIIMPSVDDQGDVVLLHSGNVGGIPQYTVHEDWVEGAAGPSLAGLNGDLKVADLDGDGDDDVAITEPQAGASAVRRILWNDAGTRLVELAADRYPESGNDYDVSLGDLDRDGDIDLMFGNRFSALGPVLINKGGRNAQMRFDPPASADFWLTQSPGGVIPAGANVDFGLSVSPGDFDLDGDLDLLTGGFYRMGLWVSNLFQQPGQARDWVFVLDKTNSMVDETVDPVRDFFEPAKNVLATFSMQRRDDDAVGFVTLEYEGTDVNNPDAADDANKAQRVVEVGDQSYFTLAETIRAVPLGTCHGNCTPIGWGIKTGMEMAAGAPVPDPDLPREQVLVLATDGEQNQAPHPDEIIPDLPAHVRLYTIALGSDTDDRMLSALATNGGKFYFAGRSDDYTSVQSDLREVDDDIEGDATGKQPLLPLADLKWATSLADVLRESPIVARALAPQPALLALEPTAVGALAAGRQRFLFLVDPADREVRFDLSWRNPNRAVEMAVTDPRGQLLDPATDERVALRRWTRALSMTVLDPLSGVWIVDLVGGGDLGPLKATGMASSALTLVGEPEHPRFDLGETLTVTAVVRDGATAVPGISGQARCLSPAEIETIVGGQASAGGLRFECGAANEAGAWKVELTVFGPPARPFVRTWQEAVLVAALAPTDLDLRSAELALDRSTLIADGGDSATASLRIRRRDGTALSGATVRFLVRGGRPTGSVTDHGDGRYTQSITGGRLVGRGELMARAGIERLPNRVEFTIVAGAYDPARSGLEVIVGPKLLCTNQQGTYAVQALALDAADNPIAGASVEIDQTAGRDVTWVGPVSELGPGVYERRFEVPRRPTRLVFAATVDGVDAGREAALDVFAPDSEEGRLAGCSDLPVPPEPRGCAWWVIVLVVFIVLIALVLWWLLR